MPSNAALAKLAAKTARSGTDGDFLDRWAFPYFFFLVTDGEFLERPI
jgi:hypothetical protein